jgi:hypothetical protein
MSAKTPVLSLREAVDVAVSGSSVPVSGWEAALVRRLAADVESEESLSARAAAARVLLEVFGRLEARAPAVRESSPLDDLKVARERRRSTG